MGTDFMLTQESFLKRIKQPNSPSWLAVGVDTQDDSQLYIAVNGGMNIRIVSIRNASLASLSFNLSSNG